MEGEEEAEREGGRVRERKGVREKGRERKKRDREDCWVGVQKARGKKKKRSDRNAGMNSDKRKRIGREGEIRCR